MIPLPQNQRLHNMWHKAEQTIRNLAATVPPEEVTSLRDHLSGVLSPPEPEEAPAPATPAVDKPAKPTRKPPAALTEKPDPSKPDPLT